VLLRLAVSNFVSCAGEHKYQYTQITCTDSEDSMKEIGDSLVGIALLGKMAANFFSCRQSLKLSCQQRL